MPSSKEVHQRYNQSEKGRERNRRYRAGAAGKSNSARQKAKRRESGVCVTCGRPKVEGFCPICVEGGTIRKQLSREMLRGTD